MPAIEGAARGSSRPPWRASLGRWLLDVVALPAAFCLLVELGCRIALGNATLDPAIYVASNDQPGYRLAAGQRAKVRQLGRAVLVTTDAVGARSTAGASRPGAEVVHVIGDSQVFGWGLSDLETVPARLQHELGPAYRVVNHGVPGYGPREYDAIARELPLEDWVVIVLTEQNDLWDSYGPRWLASAVCGYMTSRASAAGRLIPCWLRESRALQWGAEAFRSLSTERQPTPFGYDPLSFVAGRVLMGRIELLLDSSRWTRGPKLLVSFVPWSARYRPERLTRFSPEPTRRSALAFPDDCSIEGAFSAYAGPPEDLYITDDDHLAPRGAEVLAQAIARRFLEVARGTHTSPTSGDASP